MHLPGDQLQLTRFTYYKTEDERSRWLYTFVIHGEPTPGTYSGRIKAEYKVAYTITSIFSFGERLISPSVLNKA